MKVCTFRGHLTSNTIFQTLTARVGDTGHTSRPSNE